MLDDVLPSDDGGRAFERVGMSGTRELVYYLSSPAHPWTVVILMPYERVLSLATEVATPLALILGAAGMALFSNL